MRKFNVFSTIKMFVKKQPIISLIVLIGVLVGFIALNIEIIHYTSNPSFCTKCHPKKEAGPLGEVFTWSQNIHAKSNVACLDCHAKPGLINYMLAKMKGLSDVYNFVLKGEKHMFEELKKIYNDPVYAAKKNSMESCLFCHTDYYNAKFRKERIITFAGLSFRTLDTVVNPNYRKSKNMIDILTDDIRRNPDIDPKHAAHIKADVNCLFCHRRVAHGGQYVNLVSSNICQGEMVCQNCHMKNKDTINMKDLTLAKAGNPARFSHNFHVQMFDCNTCHPSLFKMKAGTSNISFATHTTDKYCFSCHGQNKMASYSCESCHK